MSGTKHDTGKAPIGLIPHESLKGTAAVLAFGAKKYAAHNWRGGFDWSRLIDAAYRHLTDFNAGIDLDPESGLPHIDHLACCVAFLQAHYHSNIGKDDRYKMPPQSVSIPLPDYITDHKVPALDPLAAIPKVDGGKPVTLSDLISQARTDVVREQQRADTFQWKGKVYTRVPEGPDACKECALHKDLDGCRASSSADKGSPNSCIAGKYEWREVTAPTMPSVGNGGW